MPETQISSIGNVIYKKIALQLDQVGNKDGKLNLEEQKQFADALSRQTGIANIVPVFQPTDIILYSEDFQICLDTFNAEVQVSKKTNILLDYVNRNSDFILQYPDCLKLFKIQYGKLILGFTYGQLASLQSTDKYTLGVFISSNIVEVEEAISLDSYIDHRQVEFDWNKARRQLSAVSAIEQFTINGNLFLKISGYYKSDQAGYYVGEYYINSETGQTVTAGNISEGCKLFKDKLIVSSGFKEKGFSRTDWGPKYFELFSGEEIYISPEEFIAGRTIELKDSSAIILDSLSPEVKLPIHSAILPNIPLELLDTYHKETNLPQKIKILQDYVDRNLQDFIDFPQLFEAFTLKYQHISLAFGLSNPHPRFKPSLNVTVVKDATCQAADIHIDDKYRRSKIQFARDFVLFDCAGQQFIKINGFYSEHEDSYYAGDFYINTGNGQVISTGDTSNALRIINGQPIVTAEFESKWWTSSAWGPEYYNLITGKKIVIRDNIGTFPLFDLTTAEIALEQADYPAWMKLRDKPDVSLEDQLLAVRQCAQAIRYLKEPSQLLIEEAFKKDCTIIQYFDEKMIPEALLVEAVAKNPLFYFYLKYPSEKVTIALLENNGSYVRFIKQPSIPMQIAAVSHSSPRDNGFFYISEPSNIVKQAALKARPELIKDMEDPSDILILIALESNPTVIKYIPNPSVEMQLFVVNKAPYYAEYINNLDEDIQLMLLNDDLLNFRYIRKPTAKALAFYGKYESTIPEWSIGLGPISYEKYQNRSDVVLGLGILGGVSWLPQLVGQDPSLIIDSPSRRDTITPNSSFAFDFIKPFDSFSLPMGIFNMLTTNKDGGNIAFPNFISVPVVSFEKQLLSAEGLGALNVFGELNYTYEEFKGEKDGVELGYNSDVWSLRAGLSAELLFSGTNPYRLFSFSVMELFLGLQYDYRRYYNLKGLVPNTTDGINSLAFFVGINLASAKLNLSNLFKSNN